MDAQITSSVIGGVVGAIAGGIVPYMIYLSTEKKKKREKQLEYLHILEKEIEGLSHKCSELKFNLQRKTEEAHIEEILKALENIRIFMTKDLYELQHTLPYHALFVDSETLNKSMGFMVRIQNKISEEQQKITKIREAKENGAEMVKELTMQQVKHLMTQLEFIEEECDVLKKVLLSKVNDYYESYLKKYIKV